MTMKKEGIEPTYGKVIAACPKAKLNPTTKRPWSKNSVYAVLSEGCYDDDPCLPWVHKARFSKHALAKEMMQRRVNRLECPPDILAVVEARRDCREVVVFGRLDGVEGQIVADWEAFGLVTLVSNS